MKICLVLTIALPGILISSSCRKNSTEAEYIRGISGGWRIDGRIGSWIPMYYKLEPAEQHQLTFVRNQYTFVNADNGELLKGTYKIVSLTDSYKILDFEPALPVIGDAWPIHGLRNDTLFLGDNSADGPITALVRQE